MYDRSNPIASVLFDIFQHAPKRHSSCADVFANLRKSLRTWLFVIWTRLEKRSIPVDFGNEPPTLENRVLDLEGVVQLQKSLKCTSENTDGQESSRIVSFSFDIGATLDRKFDVANIEIALFPGPPLFLKVPEPKRECEWEGAADHRTPNFEPHSGGGPDCSERCRAGNRSPESESYKYPARPCSLHDRLVA